MQNPENQSLIKRIPDYVMRLALIGMFMFPIATLTASIAKFTGVVDTGMAMDIIKIGFGICLESMAIGLLAWEIDRIQHPCKRFEKMIELPYSKELTWFG